MKNYSAASIFGAIILGIVFASCEKDFTGPNKAAATNSTAVFTTAMAPTKNGNPIIWPETTSISKKAILPILWPDTTKTR